jgi:alkylated DNA repair dioxygenase AlkB
MQPDLFLNPAEPSDTFDHPLSLNLGEQCVRVYPHFVSSASSVSLFNEVKATTAWRQDTIRIAGKTIAVPRLQCWMGDAHCRYAYSGIPLVPVKWTDTLREIRDQASAVTGLPLNCVLANLYRDGSDSVAWHADDEPQLGESPAIVSVSLGESRKFQFKRKPRLGLSEEQLTERHEILLETGMLVLMEPGVQEHWVHQVPKTKRPVGARINLTFRYIPPR